MLFFIAVATSIFLFIAWRRECRQLNKKINDLFINPQFIKEKTEICIKQKSNNQGSEDKKVYNSAKSDIPVFPRQELEDAIRGVDPTDIPLHRFDSILGLDGKLVDLERACDPDDSKRAECFIGEWNGRKSPTLECLMDSCDGYGPLSQFLVYPKEYLEEKIMDKSLTFSESQAFLINEFFHFISRASIKWDETEKNRLILFVKNKFGNFAFGDTGLILKTANDHKIIGKQKPDGTIVDLTDDDIGLCQRRRLAYIPNYYSNLVSQSFGHDKSNNVLKIKELKWYTLPLIQENLFKGCYADEDFYLHKAYKLPRLMWSPNINYLPATILCNKWRVLDSDQSSVHKQLWFCFRLLLKYHNEFSITIDCGPDRPIFRGVKINEQEFRVYPSFGTYNELWKF